jgi:hypothetical protein
MCPAREIPFFPLVQVGEESWDNLSRGIQPDRHRKVHENKRLAFHSNISLDNLV